MPSEIEKNPHPLYVLYHQAIGHSNYVLKFKQVDR